MHPHHPVTEVDTLQIFHQHRNRTDLVLPRMGYAYDAQVETHNLGGGLPAVALAEAGSLVSRVSLLAP